MARLEFEVCEAAILYRQTVLGDVAPDAPAGAPMSKPHATLDVRVNQFCRDIDALVAARKKVEAQTLYRPKQAQHKFHLNQQVQISPAGIAAGLDSPRDGIVVGLEGENVQISKGPHRGWWHMDFWESAPCT